MTVVSSGVQVRLAIWLIASSMSGRTPRWVDSSEWMMVASVSMMNSDLTDMPRSSLNTPYFSLTSPCGQKSESTRGDFETSCSSKFAVTHASCTGTESQLISSSSAPTSFAFSRIPPRIPSCLVQPPVKDAGWKVRMTRLPELSSS